MGVMRMLGSHKTRVRVPSDRPFVRPGPCKLWTDGVRLGTIAAGLGQSPITEGQMRLTPPKGRAGLVSSIRKCSG